MELPFPQDGALTLEEAILLAGGLTTNAVPEVMIIRTPVENSEERIYQRVDLRDRAGLSLQPQGPCRGVQPGNLYGCAR